MTFTDELRQLLLAHPDVNRLCRDANVCRQSVWRFLAGKRDLRMRTIDKLAKAMRLRLVKEWSWQDQSAR